MSNQVERREFTRRDFLKVGGGGLLSAALLGAAGCSGSSSSGGEQVTLQFGHNAPEDSPTGKAAQRLAELAGEKTDGGLTIEVFPSNQLGDNRSLVEQTSSGSIAMSMQGIGILGYILPVYSLMQAPFLFRSQEHIHEVLEGEIGQDLSNRLQEEQSIMTLSQTWDRLPRQLTANKEITQVDDLNGMLLRTGSEGATETFQVLGAEPTSIPLDDLYVALQQGTVQGVDLPTDYVADLSLDEVNSHLNMLNHTYGTQYVAVNAERFDSLPEQYRTALQEAVNEAGQYNNQQTSDAESRYIDDLREGGMTIVDVSEDQREGFVEIVRQNLGELENSLSAREGLGEEILSVGQG